MSEELLVTPEVVSSPSEAAPQVETNETAGSPPAEEAEVDAAIAAILNKSKEESKPEVEEQKKEEQKKEEQDTYSKKLNKFIKMDKEFQSQKTAFQKEKQTWEPILRQAAEAHKSGDIFSLAKAYGLSEEDVIAQATNKVYPGKKADPVNQEVAELKKIVSQLQGKLEERDSISRKETLQKNLDYTKGFIKENIRGDTHPYLASLEDGWAEDVIVELIDTAVVNLKRPLSQEEVLSIIEETEKNLTYSLGKVKAHKEVPTRPISPTVSKSLSGSATPTSLTREQQEAEDDRKIAEMLAKYRK